MVGSTISHYRIAAKLGEGGMGVVYRAEDLKLERTVALKFLPPHLLGNDDVRKRFEREAKAAASLHHANICPVHEIDEADGKAFISMALIEGESLDKKIAQGPLKLNDALDIAQQIAKGLEAAHKKGIFHRDIKPENIMVGEDGHVTIMDFGLAQLTEASRLTKKDETLGTIYYMSPEQAEGSGTDHRTDIWALGVVVYEMVTGQHPFKGDYDQAILYSVLNEDPEPVTALRTGVPIELEGYVNKALAKRRDERYQSAADLIADLKTLERRLESSRSRPLTTAASPVGTRHAASASKLPWVIAAVSMALALGLAVVNLREVTEPPPNYSFTVPLPESRDVHTFSLSPDGTELALSLADSDGRMNLWLRSLETREMRQIPDTIGATYPFWSPDGAFIGFFQDGKLKKLARSGGPAQSLCDAPDGRGGSWSADGFILFAPDPFGEIHRVPEGGGEPAALTRRDESEPGTSRRFPQVLPDGRHFIYSDGRAEEKSGIYLGSVDGAEPRRLLPDESNAVYVSSQDGKRGFLLFFREGALMAAPLDPERLDSVGGVFPVVDRVGRAANRSNYAFSVSQGGALVYAGSETQEGRSQLTWRSRDGVELEKVGEPADIRMVDLAPDGSGAALILGRQDGGLSFYDFTRNLMSPLSSGATWFPVWSPDSSEIAFTDVGERPGIYRMPVRPVGSPELIRPIAGGNAGPLDWSPDGRFLCVYQQLPATGRDLYILPLEGDGKLKPYISTPYHESSGTFSPNGRWLAYESERSGRPEVYLRAFPEGDRDWLVSDKGGDHPIWRSDGKELFYVASDGMLTAISVDAGETVDLGTPQLLFPVEYRRYLFRTFDAADDGQTFLVAKPIEDPDRQAELIFLSDWMQSAEE